MLSAPYLTVEFEHPDTKIDQINQHCVALSAGDTLCVQDILVGGLEAANQLQNPTIQELAERIRMQFCNVRKQRINDVVFGPRGLDFDTFYQQGLISQFPADLAMLLDNEVQQTELETTFLVAGVDVAGAHIFSVSDPGTMVCLDRIGYDAIGSGHRHAVLKLVSMGQHVSSGLNQTVFNVFCAKKIAELAPGVGQATSMGIVTEDGTKFVEQSVLDRMEPAYHAQATPTLNRVQKVVQALPFDNGEDNAS